MVPRSIPGHQRGARVRDNHGRGALVAALFPGNPQYRLG
jgi:hypothetical protein